MKLKLCVLQGLFTIHRLSPESEIPNQVFDDHFYSISKTSDELSIVCSSSVAVHSESSEEGWACIKLLGPLDFSLTGILADIATILAKEKISIFAISTFETDYILLKSKMFAGGENALVKAGYTFSNCNRISR